MMKKAVVSLLCVFLLSLAGCAGEPGVYQIESMRGWCFQENPGTNDYSVFFGLLDKNDRAIDAAVDADIRIVNENDEQVYEATVSVTPEDFGTYTSEVRGEEYLAEIRIPREDITAGSSASGTVYLTIYKEDIIHFDEVNCMALWCLPTLDVTLETDPLPKVIAVKDYSGRVVSKIQMDDVSFTYEGDYSPKLNVVVSGQKISGTADSMYDIIGYKLYDSEGYMIEAGKLFLDSIGSGDKFKDDSITFYDVVPGETYTLKFSESAW